MEMSNTYMPELHVAQQRRRDKLRVQQLEEFHTNNFHQNNTSSLVFPSEMFNFTGSHSSTFPNIHPSRIVAPSSSEPCDPQPLQSCESWVVNYDDSGRRNVVMAQFGSQNSCNPSTEMSAAHQFYQNNSNVHNWGHGGGNELALLPSFVSQSNDANPLSLSLSSNRMSVMQQRLGELPDVKPDLMEGGSMSSVVKCGNNQIEGHAVGSSNHPMAQNVGPLGPFTGYTTILKSSKFLKPAQQLLDEFLSAAGLKHARGCDEFESVTTPRSRSVADFSDVLGSDIRKSSDLSASRESYRPVCHEKKANLIHIQEEVCKRHRQYHQQMEMVIAAFEAVPGLSNATPYISHSLRTISRHFRCVKNAIADQIKSIKRVLGEDLSSPTSFVKGESSSRFDHGFAKIKSGPAGGTDFAAPQNHVWRPQRGLPERAVSVLRAWLFDHFLHPYPTDTDKQMLASQTGLSRNQVSNWFINARVRVWKPMVEEIHMLETKGMSRSETNPNNRLAAENHKSNCNQSVNTMHDSRQLGSSSCMEGSSCGEANTEQLLQKCSRVEHHQIPSSIDGSFVSFLPYQRRGLELGGIGAVSLTLGLRHGSENSHQQQLQHTFQPQGMHFGGHVVHDFSG